MRLHIPPILIQTAQVICYIPAIKLSRLKSIPQKRKHILIAILNLIVLVSRLLHHLQKVQSATRPNGRLPIRFTLLEPAATRTGPRSALQEQIGVLTKLGCRLALRGQGLDVFDLALCDACEYIAGPLLNERHERAVAQRSVWSAEREGVGERGDPDAQIRCHACWAAPECAQVGAVGNEGKAGQPGCVEASCADDNVDIVCDALMVDEACFSDGTDGVGKCGGVV